MAVLRGGDLNGPATHASGGAYPSTTSSKLGFKRRARPRGPTGPRRPSGALGQRGPLGPAPRRFGPLAAHGEQAGLRGRPLSVASCNQGSDTGSGRWTRIEDSWVVEQRVGWCAMRRGGEPWRGLLII